jgi:acyl-CoA synthetase (AMP-forming)/AMP-acid ligase II
MIHSTIASLIESSCATKADAELIADENQSLTGRALWTRVSAVALNLHLQGLRKGDVVAFYSASSVPHAVTFFACLVSGIVPCCLHTRETPERNKKNIEYIKAKCLFAEVDLWDSALSLIEEGSIILLSPDFINVEKNSTFNINLAPNDTALILISSGTTGVPKCILHSQKTLAATAEYGPYSYGCWSNEDSTIVVMAPSFAAWIHTVLPFIFIQGRIFFGSSFDPLIFLKLLEREKITLAPLVPTLWRMVMAENTEKFDLSNLRVAFFSGEPGSESLVDDLHANICSNIMTSYLASEGGCASGIVAGSDILVGAGQISSTGHPVKDAEMQIINPDGAIDDYLSTGEIGEITLKSASIAIGYFDNPALSDKSFHGGWWRSGDLGMIDDKGLLYVKGRLDNRINTGGIKVHAEDVEASLLKHPLVQLAAVIGVPDKKWGQKIVAHLVVSCNDVDEEEILYYCQKKGLLPKAHLPKEIYFHESLPTGPTGKLYRRGLINL